MKRLPSIELLRFIHTNRPYTFYFVGGLHWSLINFYFTPTNNLVVSIAGYHLNYEDYIAVSFYFEQISLYAGDVQLPSSFLNRRVDFTAIVYNSAFDHSRTKREAYLFPQVRHNPLSAIDLAVFCLFKFLASDFDDSDFEFEDSTN